MNKDYLPFYDSLKDDDKEFWLNCSKEELIDHIVSNIRNGEALLSRIDKAIEELELWKPKNKAIKTEIDCLLDILKGSE